MSTNPTPAAMAPQTVAPSPQPAVAAPVTVATPSPQPSSSGSGTNASPTAGNTVPTAVVPAPETHVHQTVKVIQEVMLNGAQPVLSFFLPEGNIERKLDRGDEMRCAEDVIYDAEFVRKAETVLRRHRFILISGEPESGKITMAIYLACRIREDGLVPEDTFVYSPHDHDVKINLAVLADEKKLQGRIIIFRDALDLGNASLLHFLGTGEALANITGGFEKAGSYIIFTASQHTLPPGCQGALPNDLRPTLPLPGAEALHSGVAHLIGRFLLEESHRQWRDQKVETATVQRIAAWALTMSRAQQFINRHFGDVLSGTPLEEAFQRFESLIPWFRKNAFDRSPRNDSELRLHREAWIYCLALVVAQPLGPEGVPCYEFLLLYEALRRHLLGPSRIGLSRRAYREAELQRLAHAEVVRKPSGVRDLIFFKDTRATDQLWKVLLTDFRSLALGLVPTLLKLAEQPGLARYRAAQAIGRIGLIDGQEISERNLSRWADKDDWSIQVLAGYLVQGALRTGDISYRDCVLNYLEGLIADEKAWTAVAAYKQLGRIEISLALNRLKRVADILLQRAFEKSQAIDNKINHFEKQLANSGSVKEVLGNIARIDYLLGLYRDIFDDEEEIAQALTYALVSLAITEGPAPVLEALARWSLGTPQMSWFVCQVFLQEEGIAYYLTKRKVILPSMGSVDWGESRRCSAILASLADDPVAIRVLAGFLEKMYTGLIDFFSNEGVHELTHVITDYLKAWIKESLRVPTCRSAMVVLAGSLLHSPVAELRNRISDWLAADSEFLNGPMQLFVSDARAHGLGAARRRP